MPLKADSSNKPVVRAMTVSDLLSVLDIERTTQVVPWSRLSFEEVLVGDYQCSVIVQNHSVIAFFVVSEIEGEVHIINLAVAQNRQGQGLGHFLMHNIIAFAESVQASKIFLEVRASNLAAQSLYQKWQFEQIAIRPKYYRVPDSKTNGQAVSKTEKEDAFVLVRQL